MKPISNFSQAFIDKIKQFISKVDFSTKLLTSNLTVDGVMNDLTFVNLEVGKEYRIGGVFAMQSSLASGNNEVFFVIDNGAQRVAIFALNSNNNGDQRTGINEIFTATETSLTFTGAGTNVSTFIRGDGTRNMTHITLEELPNHQVTNKWD
jgi:hypothetical protein